MSEIVTPLFNAVFGFFVDKARDLAAKKLKKGDVTDHKIREFIQREMNDIKSKLDTESLNRYRCFSSRCQVSVPSTRNRLRDREISNP